MFHFIYKTTHTPSGKYYIGKHSTNDLDDGYFGSGYALNLSIKYHGKEEFQKEILEFCESEKEAYKKEALYVTEDTLADKMSYNLVPGGKQGKYFMTEDCMKNSVDSKGNKK